MKKTKALPEPNKAQQICEAILKWGIPGIAFFHIALLLAEHFIGTSLSNTLLSVEKWILVILSVFGIGYCFYTMFAFPEQRYRIKAFLKGMFRMEAILLSMLFIWNIFCVISADSIYKENLWQLNDNILFELTVCFFILFIFGYILPKRQAKMALDIAFIAIVAMMTGLMIWVLHAVCVPSVIHLPGGGSIGMTSASFSGGGGRLSISCHPNTVGAYAEVILMMCLYLAVTKKGIIRIFSIFAMIIHYFVLILSDSRTCIIAAAFSIGVVAFKLVFDAAKGKDVWKRWAFGFLALVVCFALVIGLQKPVRIGYESISHFSELTSSSTEPSGREMELTTNGRNILWTAAVKSAFSGPRNAVFGVTPVAVVSEITKWSGTDWGYTHNQFLEVLVANGIPGLVLYLAWLVLIAIKCVKNVLLKDGSMQKGMIVIGGMILMLVIANLFEATLVYYRFFTEGIFFLLCGIVGYQDEKTKMQVERKSYHR